MKAECKNSVCYWFKKFNIIKDYELNKNCGVIVTLKNGTKLKGLNGSNQFRQYLVDDNGNKFYLDLDSMRIKKR